jgi:hypothetical protein
MKSLEQFSASWLMSEEAWMVEIELFHSSVPNRSVYLFLKMRKKFRGLLVDEGAGYAPRLQPRSQVGSHSHFSQACSASLPHWQLDADQISAPPERVITRFAPIAHPLTVREKRIDMTNSR